MTNMTVPSATNRSGPYNGNGVTTVFDYEFKITNENYIKVIKADAAGVETILTIDADYIVSDVGDSAGGQVALTVPLPTGQTLTMIPSVPFTQEIDLENQGAYYAETVETALDLSVMRDQQLQEQINRAVTIPPSEDPAQLGGLVHDILRLADSAENIDTVAQNIGAVNTAAANMAAIIAAPAQAAAAAASATSASAAVFVANKWATEAEDVPVNDGVNPSGFSAFHWMRKALGYATSASAAAIAAATSAASINLPAIVANTFLQAKADATGYDTKTPTQVKATLGVPYFNVMEYGAVADDATDCTAAFAAAIAAALAVGGSVVYIPRGTYWFANASAELDPGTGKLTFLGDGMNASILHFEEGAAVGSFTAPTYKCIFKGTTNTAKGEVAFRHLQFKGTLAGDPGRHGGVPVWLDYYSNVIFDACKFYSLTGMAMDIHYCKRAEVRNCWFEDIAADGPRIRDTPNVIVENNYILRNGDDAIAIHTSDASATGTREGVIVANNHLVNAGCIKVLAGRVVHVVNNRIELGNLCGIQVLTNAGGAEGNYPIRDIIVANNIILDTLYYNGALSGQLASNIIVKAGAAVGQASTHNTRPGRYDATAAAWVYPWDYDEVDVDSGTSVVPPVYGVRVSGNIMRRSRPAVGAFSSYGAGTRMWQGVATDPAVTDAHLISGFGINMGGSMSDALVTENVIECTANGFSLDAPTYNGQYEHFIIARNAIRDTLNRAILLNTGSFSVDVSVEDNDIDADPYRRNANSNINGTYAAASVPRGIDLGNIVGVKIRRNRLRNCSQPLSCNFPAQCVVDGNILSGAPSVVGFNVVNKGIGVVEQASGRFLWEIIDADPTSATYGAVTNTQTADSAAMPATGTYVAGAFVRNSAPAAGSAIEGWLRLTTGSAHVLGTDWATVGCMKLTGTATYDPPSLVDAAGATTNVAVTGASLGDAAVASFSLDTQGITITAWVSAANTVSVRFQNESGGTLDIGSGTLKATVFKS
ncbi:glycosyl hydrolase family 28-related protein [Mesorhizobium sp. M4B.F.Ca.ET.013.02.1.1]|uniref:right-handed parallel beta-helix repeat-containing protein n=1 Tax=Mesorhizobium sp. M4B.F.Ca.ET.013.02.1.1 TaxID=2496755 RepID=UPI000FD45006|nr:glycosyl hydrolase family 28-related protein [Mesorhizobium sp. M4B.F.Ca.ET.013.02.1.1]RUW24663.1 hypothetical protein EOA34_14290 [Mesorhizobium sp. M4B.F.Ca.ET.013.02.1.1]